MKNILMVEDDSTIAFAVKYAVEQEGFNLDIAENLENARKIVNSKEYDLILLDVMLPDEDGLEILRKIRQTPETRRVPVIMVTAKTTELDKVKGLDLGADDYITKPFGIMELISRVKALLRRTGSSDEEKLIGIGSLFIDDEKRVAYVDDKPVELTYKEYELLKYLALNRGIVLTRDNIMDRIWSTDYEGESRTLDVHIKTLRHKLGTAGNYIKTVRNVGYFMDDEAK